VPEKSMMVRLGLTELTVNPCSFSQSVIFLGHAVGGAELLRRQPFVIVGRAFVGEAGGIGIESRLLRIRSLQKQLHVIHRQAVVDLTHIVGRGGFGTDVAFEGDARRIVDGAVNARLWSGTGLCRGRNHKAGGKNGLKCQAQTQTGDLHALLLLNKRFKAENRGVLRFRRCIRAVCEIA
jgi:hypothetical protein